MPPTRSPRLHRPAAVLQALLLRGVVGAVHDDLQGHRQALVNMAARHHARAGMVIEQATGGHQCIKAVSQTAGHASRLLQMSSCINATGHGSRANQRTLQSAAVWQSDEVHTGGERLQQQVWRPAWSAPSAASWTSSSSSSHPAWPPLCYVLSVEPAAAARGKLTDIQS